MWEYKYVYEQLSLHLLLSKCEEMGVDGWELICVTYEVEEVDTIDGLHDDPINGQWVGVLKRKRSSVMMWEYKYVYDRRFHPLLLECEEEGADGWELISVTYEVEDIERDAEMFNHPLRGQWWGVLKRKKSS